MKSIQKFALNNVFSYNKSTKTLSAEASDLGWPVGSRLNQFELINKKTGKSQIFNHFKTDKDSSGEDTYGWWFQSNEGIKVLIIND